MKIVAPPVINQYNSNQERGYFSGGIRHQASENVGLLIQGSLNQIEENKDQPANEEDIDFSKTQKIDSAVLTSEQKKLNKMPVPLPIPKNTGSSKKTNNRSFKLNLGQVNGTDTSPYKSSQNYTSIASKKVGQAQKSIMSYQSSNFDDQHIEVEENDEQYADHLGDLDVEIASNIKE